MAQAPATSKFRRAVHRALVPLGLTVACRFQKSERAALSLRQLPKLQPPVDPTVLFLIPLVGRHQVGNWDAVVARLARTLQSFAAQTSPHWRTLICGQDRPELAFDERVQFVPFTREISGNDKWDKLDTLCDALRDRPDDGYALPFDADDLLACDAVEHMVSSAAPAGYLVTHGYVLDAGAGTCAKASPQSLLHPGQKALWKLCGSCAAFRLSPSEGVAGLEFLRAAIAHEHRMFPYLASLAGRRLQPIPGPSVLYILNHGENFGARRGRVSFKTRFVERYADTSEATRSDLSRRFGAADLLSPQKA